MLSLKWRKIISQAQNYAQITALQETLDSLSDFRFVNCPHR
jgi:hypothetical protein